MKILTLQGSELAKWGKNIRQIELKTHLTCILYLVH